MFSSITKNSLMILIGLTLTSLSAEARWPTLGGFSAKLVGNVVEIRGTYTYTAADGTDANKKANEARLQTAQTCRNFIKNWGLTKRGQKMIFVRNKFSRARQTAPFRGVFHFGCEIRFSGPPIKFTSASICGDPNSNAKRNGFPLYAYNAFLAKGRKICSSKGGLARGQFSLRNVRLEYVGDRGCGSLKRLTYRANAAVKCNR